jgi:DNA-nicking Smr family endonuclease
LKPIKFDRKQGKAIIDLHGLTAHEGECELVGLFNSPQIDGIKKVEVVTGYRGGLVLKKMVDDFHNYRIDYKITMPGNEGTTILWLK